MTDDIVARLRDYESKVLAAPPYYRELIRIAADEIERLRADRDAARAEVCLLRAANTNANEGTTKAMEDYAASRSWFDLFKDEDAKAE